MRNVDDIPEKHKILLVIDSDNLFAAQKDHLNWWIDPNKLKNYIANYLSGPIVGAHYYCSYYDNVPEGKDKFLKALMHMGYSIIQRPVKHITQADGSIKDKANMDVIITRDICLQVDNYDILVLVSGDGDFAPVIEALHNRGKRAYVLSTEGIVSRDLRELVGVCYIDLASLKDDIFKEQSYGNGKES